MSIPCLCLCVFFFFSPAQPNADRIRHTWNTAVIAPMYDNKYMDAVAARPAGEETMSSLFFAGIPGNFEYSSRCV
jgi:hypothetical protein